MVQQGFQKKNLCVVTQREELGNWLKNREVKNATILLMSSGNFDNFDIETFAKQITQAAF